MFGALVKFAIAEPAPSGHYGRTTLFVAGTSGLLTTILGIALVFFPAQQITSLCLYEVWMLGGTLFFVGLAAFFFLSTAAIEVLNDTRDRKGHDFSRAVGRLRIWGFSP